MGSVYQHYLLARMFVFALRAILPLRRCPFFMSAFFRSHAPLVFPSSPSLPTAGRDGLARPGSPGRLRGRVSSSLGRLGPVRVPSLSSDRSGDRPCQRVITPRGHCGHTPLAREGVVRRPSVSTDPTTTRPALVGQSASAASLQSLPLRRPRAEPSRVATLKRRF